MQPEKGGIILETHGIFGNIYDRSVDRLGVKM